jgi:hypothetical protein
MFEGILAQWVENWKYSLLLSTCPNLMVYNHEIAFQKGRQTVKMGHQEIAGVLWESVMLCCAFPCSGVDFATDIPRARLLKIQYLQIQENRYSMRPLSHNPKVVGSNPTPLPIFPCKFSGLR